ncbi:hypothetical protein [Glycomyces dulcitolivorans]|uniref:hypothetical protein n=1 Tax=Glycomyces dulcitolivorans TaxID=2200759 RepID=UPI001300897E|nr:hypothetical protein [Glycomyces dulcitolivorans]
MADAATTTDPPLYLITAEAEGYCDPETGACALPGGTDQGEADQVAPATPTTDR